ncbi:insulin receptor substrate 1-like [Ahaetulla prasina]|uniref:insulin receptor substrate 1-like n=1 Tax=Ahaetulla prasina TaxID=499056 RepID=UPI002649B861|nr:insulin receptor substrate 1-like [Ahaetulla prasina]XP_058037319.1 insulin receptor substrate 1-like [Ahaetulla prasina]
MQSGCPPGLAAPQLHSPLGSPTMDPGNDPLLFADIRLCGYLRKQKSRRRRYFVLRCGGERGPPRLEYYENEKKFRAGGLCSRPKKTLLLEGMLTINKRADARHQHLIVLCGREGTFGVAAESAEQQEAWYLAMVELHGKGTAPSEGDGEAAQPVPAFKEVWQVSLRPRGLGHSRNLAGVYLLCLTEKTVSFVRLNSDEAAVVLQLLNIRRCGHSENYFFMEVGRSAATGPGELWMQVEDLVVAQNMHETILEAMKALSEDFRGPGRGQALPSTPILVPARRQPHGNPLPSQGGFPWRSRPEGGTPSLGWSPATLGQKKLAARKPDSLSDYSAMSSDEGGSSPGELRPPSTPDPLSAMVVDGELDYISMGQRISLDGASLPKWPLEGVASKRASLPPLVLGKGTPGLLRRRQCTNSAVVSASYPEGLNLHGADPGYMAMLPGAALGPEEQDYVPMTPSSVSPPRESGGYMLMSPSRSCSPDGMGQWAVGGEESKSPAGEYVNMSPAGQAAPDTPSEYLLLPLLGPPPVFSPPHSCRRGPRAPWHPASPRRLSCSSSTSSESLEEAARYPLGLLVDPPGGAKAAASYSGANYVNLTLRVMPADSSQVSVPDCSSELLPGPPFVSCHCEAKGNAAPLDRAPRESGLNYIDLDLALPLRLSAGPCQAQPPHSYASIDFQRLGELPGASPKGPPEL